MPSIDNSLHAIVYVSSAVKHYSSNEFSQLIAPIKTSFKEINLSGLVIYANGNGLTMIEGGREAVEAQYQLNRSHPGHHDIIKLFDRPIQQRYFEDYVFAVKAINSSEFKSIDDFESGEHKEYWHEYLSLTDDPIVKIIKDFLRYNS
jgi:hypothetical protein